MAIGLSQNWRFFIKTTRKRCHLHIYTAWYWNILHTVLNIAITLLTGIATLVSAIDSTNQKIPTFVVPLIAGLATLVASINAFLKPAERYQNHKNAAHQFNILMFKMIRCSNKNEYDELWNELYQAKLNEPFLIKKRHLQEISELQNMSFPITTQFKKVIKEQERLPESEPPTEETPLLNGGTTT